MADSDPHSPDDVLSEIKDENTCKLNFRLFCSFLIIILLKYLNLIQLTVLMNLMTSRNRMPHP